MTPATFFLLLVPEEWNRRLAEETARGDSPRLAKMRAADFSLVVRVDGAGGGVFPLEVEGGRMRSAPTPAAKPLLTLVMNASDWRCLADQVGPSPLALLGGVGGDRDFVLTDARLAALRGIDGVVRLQVTGADAWGVLACFGGPPASLEPGTTISIDSAEYRKLRDGSLDLQGAFMTGKLGLAGDIDKAMKLALALMSPE